LYTLFIIPHEYSPFNPSCCLFDRAFSSSYNSLLVIEILYSNPAPIYEKVSVFLRNPRKGVMNGKL